MGCLSSEVDIPMTMYSSLSPVINNLSDKNKQRLSKLIEKDDMITFAVVMSETGAEPNSQISDSKMKWMLSHLCCRWDADNCLEYLLKHYFCEHPLNYIEFVNSQTIQGYTCLHLCGLWRSQKCFYVLHHYGGLSLNARDKMMKTPYQTAVQYKCNKMRQILQTYRDLNINFTQIETSKLMSGDVIAEDISGPIKNRQKQANQMKNSVIKSNQNFKTNLLNNMSELQKQLQQQKAKLQKQKQQLLQQKLKQQLQSDAQKAKKIAEQVKHQADQISKMEYQKKIKREAQQQLKKQQQSLNSQLKAKEDELIRVKQDLKRQQQQRIKKQKEEAQKKAEQYIKQQQQQINRRLKQKQDALERLKKQEEQRAKREKQQAEKRLKKIEQDYARKQQQMNNQLKQKEQQLARVKKQQQQRARKQLEAAQKSSQQAIKKAQQQSMRKILQKQKQIQKAKQLEAERLRKQKQQAEKTALQLAYQQSKKINQQINEAKKKQQQIKNTVNNATDTVNKTANQLKQAYKKYNEQVPAQINRAYNDALSLGKFEDSQFPANNKSIGDPSKANFANFTTNTVWLRPNQILKDDFKLFDGIDPNDIKQGSLGVCYMLATLSALAQNPKNIQKIFVFYDLKLGFYVLRFFINGKPKFITVDDQIPCNKMTKSPLFTKPIGNQIWVLLIQKAWAKAVGDYLSAQAMTPDHMMEDLSSAPGFGSWFQKQATKSNTQHIKSIIKHEKLGHVVVVTSGDKKIQGIANNHAYTILNVYEHNGRVIFKIRNPWGQFQWNGQYGENSSLWTPELRTLVKFEAKNDGIFFLSENQLTQAYVYYSISLIDEKAFYSFTQFKSKPLQDLFFRVKITKPGQVNFRITQLFERMLRDKSYKYSPMVFQVGKISQDRNSVKFISEGSQKSYFGAKSVHAFESITQKLDAGQYFIRIRMLWNNPQKYNSAVLASFAPENLVFQRLSQQQGMKYAKLLFFSFGTSTTRNATGDGFYKIITMKGQFVFIGETDKDGKYKMSFKLNKSRMQMAQLDIGKTTDSDIQLTISKNQPGIATAMRTQPAKGGTTGPVSILLQKI